MVNPEVDQKLDLLIKLEVDQVVHLVVGFYLDIA